MVDKLNVPYMGTIVLCHSNLKIRKSGIYPQWLNQCNDETMKGKGIKGIIFFKCSSQTYLVFKFKLT
jgi:hypothetical protein